MWKKEERRTKKKKQTEILKAQEDDVMEKYRKLSTNDVIKNHDRKPHKIAL